MTTSSVTAEHRDRHLTRAQRPSGSHSLDHGQRRSEGPASLAIWNDELPRVVGKRKLAPLAGLDSGPGPSSAGPPHNLRAASGRGLDSGGLGPGDPSWSLLAALLPVADRRHCRHGGGLLRRRGLGSGSEAAYDRRHSINHNARSNSCRTPIDPAGSRHVFFTDIGNLRDPISRSPRLPARASPGVDHSIQRRTTMGCLA